MLQIKTEPESSSEAVQCQTCRAIIPHFKVVLQKKADFEFVFASRSILFPTKARITSFLDLSWQPTAEISNQSTVNSTMQAPRTSQSFLKVSRFERYGETPTTTIFGRIIGGIAVHEPARILKGYRSCLTGVVGTLKPG